MKKIKSGLYSVPISKKIYTALFLLLIAFAIAIGVLNYYNKTRLSYDRTALYYRGYEDCFELSLLLYLEGIEEYEENKTQAFLRSY